MCKMAHVNMANTSHRLKLKNQKIDLEMCQVNKKIKLIQFIYSPI